MIVSRWVIVCFALLGSICLNAQHKIKYDQKISNLRDQWVVLPQSADGSYQFGFVWEEKGGVTFRMEGAFMVGDTGQFIALKGDKINPRPNLKGGSDQVSIFPYDKYDDLKLTPFPTWYDKTGHDGKNVFEMYTEGLVMNRRAEYDKALVPLARAYKLNPSYRMVAYEYGVALNSNGRHQEAITVLSEALKQNPEAYLIYMELSLARIQLGHINEAMEMAEEGIERCALNSDRSEMALRIVVYWVARKDKKLAKKWLKNCEDFIQPGSRYEIQYNFLLQKMEALD